MPWSRSATTVRNAPALGFKQQYAIGTLETENVPAPAEETETDTESVAEQLATAEQEVHNLETMSHSQMEKAVPQAVEEVMDAEEAATAHLNHCVKALQNAIEDKEQADEVSRETTDILVRSVEDCTGGNGMHPDRLMAFKQIRLKHLHRRIAGLQAKLGARVQPYARPTRNLYARATPSPLSTARLSRRIERTRF